VEGSGLWVTPKGTKRNHGKPVRAVGVPANIPIGNIPNVS
jgi:hypothetical protein